MSRFGRKCTYVVVGDGQDEEAAAKQVMQNLRYEGWNFNFGNIPLDWIQELLE